MPAKLAALFMGETHAMIWLALVGNSVVLGTIP